MMRIRRLSDLTPATWMRWRPAHLVVCAVALYSLAAPPIVSGQERPLQRDGQQGRSGSSQTDARNSSSTISPLPFLDEPFETSRQLLRLLDVGPSDLDSFVDGEPIAANDEEVFLKILFRLPQISQADIARWVRTPPSWSTIATNPSAWRGEFLTLDGRARSLTRQTVPPPWAELFELDHYWEVELEVPGADTVTVFARHVPAAWSGAAKLDEKCQVQAMFLKLGAPRHDKRHFLLAAKRVAWFPDRVDLAKGIGPDQVYLADLGMDMGLFDAVRERNSKPIGAEERACFYRLLQVTQQTSMAEMAKHCRNLELGPLLQQPSSLQGQIFRLQGSVRRITRVVVDDRDIRRCYGITHYYQLDVLVPLGDAEIQVKSDDPDKTGPVYRTNFPFTCCSVSIPPQWKSLVGQERVSAAANLDGVFFKIWSYSNPYVASFDTRQRQMSPLFVIPTPVLGTPSQPQGLMPLLLGSGFLVALAAIWLAVWYCNRSDRRHSRTAWKQRVDALDEPPDFDQWEETGPSST